MPKLREYASAHAFGARALKINAALRRDVKAVTAGTGEKVELSTSGDH